MGNFLRKIKLAEDFTLNLNLSKAEFTKKLSNNTSTELTFLGGFFSKNNKSFLGVVTDDSIKIRPRKGLSTSNYSQAAELNASYSGKAQSVKIEGIIQINKKYFLLMLIPVLLYFSIVLSLFTLQSNNIQMLIALFVQFIIMIGVFYFILRKGLKITKDFFEKELFFLTKNN